MNKDNIMFDFIGNFKSVVSKIGHHASHAAHTIGKAAKAAAPHVLEGIKTGGTAILDNAGAIGGVASGLGTTLLFAAPTPVGKTIGMGLLGASAVLGGIAAIREGKPVDSGVKSVGATVKTGAETKKMIAEAYK